ncbi:MAG: precorrin-8X methylmutase [Candidatus Anammoxibacter sp.]
MSKEKVKTSVIILSHESNVATGNDGLFKIVSMLKVTTNWNSIEAGFLRPAKPDLDDVIEKVVNEGAKRVIIMPLLLCNDNHASKDVPVEIDSHRTKHPGVEFLYAKNIGPDERIAQIATDRINDVLKKNSNHNSNGKEGFRYSYINDPDAIVKESFDTIDKLLEIIGTEGMPPINLPIIKRIIHTTGDPEYGKSFIIFDGAVEAGMEALQKGKPIVTDVNMVKAGINKKLVKRLGGKVVCKIADRAVALKAKRSGKTRAITAIDESLAEIDGGIVAVGNAPSALFRIIDLVEDHKVRPALIVGVPVGFVGAAESKDALQGINVPYITNSGRKGGSAVAVTIVNAMLNMTKDGVTNTKC